MHLDKNFNKYNFKQQFGELKCKYNKTMTKELK